MCTREEWDATARDKTRWHLAGNYQQDLFGGTGTSAARAFFGPFGKKLVVFGDPQKGVPVHVGADMVRQCANLSRALAPVRRIVQVRAVGHAVIVPAFPEPG
jgi:hypothetical protein